MDAERLEIARRLVACPGWVWLVGMAYVSTDPDDKMRRGRLGLAPDGGTCFRSVEDWYHGDEADERDPSKFAEWGWLPDLDDDLTRLGVLAVVRRAWGDPEMCVRYVCRDPLPSFWMVDGKWSDCGPTEEAALLAALEAAP